MKYFQYFFLAFSISGHKIISHHTKHVGKIISMIITVRITCNMYHIIWAIVKGPSSYHPIKLMKLYFKVRRQSL